LMKFEKLGGNNPRRSKVQQPSFLPSWIACVYAHQFLENWNLSDVHSINTFLPAQIMGNNTNLEVERESNSKAFENPKVRFK